jgi:hypothetical protein
MQPCLNSTNYQLIAIPYNHYGEATYNIYDPEHNQISVSVTSKLFEIKLCIPFLPSDIRYTVLHTFDHYPSLDEITILFPEVLL